MTRNDPSPSKRPTGLAGLMVVLSGQAVSILASTMVEFALSIWVFERTSSATVLGGMTAAFTVPFLLLTPIAGAMVDRYNRKLMMMASDITAGLGTLAILLLYLGGGLQTWHFYAVNAVIGVGTAFHWPAYSAAITTMVPKEHYGRANGMMSFVETGPGIAAPMLAGLLLPLVGLEGILLIDLGALLLALATLAVVHIPQPERTAEGLEGAGSLWKEAAFGFRYILQRPSLLGFVVILFFTNFLCGFCNAVSTPLILARTGNDSVVLGSVRTAGAISFAVGGLVLSVWGGLKRRIHGFLIGWSVFWLFGAVIFALGRGVTVWVVLSLAGGIFAVLGVTSGQALLQAKVAPDVQGRVFSARRLLTWAPDMVTPLIGGAMADYWMEPAMRSDGWLSKTFAWMVGTDPGSGMAVQMFVFGVLTILVLLLGYVFPQVRNMEDILPDHDQLEKVAAPLSQE
jgi:DHA3 family macrolide efflux protein-like MFS transporter